MLFRMDIVKPPPAYVYKKIAELCLEFEKPRSTSSSEKFTSVLHMWGYLGEGNIKIKKYFR
jgi:hypothetical protein